MKIQRSKFNFFRPKLDPLYEKSKVVWRKQKELRDAIEELTSHSGNSFTPWAPEIPTEKLRNAKMYKNRFELVKNLDLGPMGIEVGTQFGNFARFLLENLEISKLSCIDLEIHLVDLTQFSNSDPVEFISGFSDICLEKFADHSVDFIYIDASHAYENFIKDITISARKIKIGGIIICNDYTVWSPGEVEPYGVLMGVNEILTDDRHNFEVVGFGLHPQGYHDIAIKRLA